MSLISSKQILSAFYLFIYLFPNSIQRSIIIYNYVSLFLKSHNKLINKNILRVDEDFGKEEEIVCTKPYPKECQL